MAGMINHLYHLIKTSSTVGAVFKNEQRRLPLLTSSQKSEGYAYREYYAEHGEKGGTFRYVFLVHPININRIDNGYKIEKKYFTSTHYDSFIEINL